jgi:hypothetical protein
MSHQLMSLYVLRRGPPPPANADRTRFDILAMVRPPSQIGMVTPTVATPETFWQGPAANFVARRGAPSEWTITLPEELVKAVRDSLKTGPVAKQK